MTENDILPKAITQVMIEAFCDEEGWSDYLEELLMVYKNIVQSYIQKL